MILFYCIIGLNNYTMIEAKITYELSRSYMTLSTEQLETEVMKLDEVCIVTRINYGEFNYENNLSDDATMEEVDAYKETKRNLARKHHETINKKVYSTFNISKYKDVYVSNFLPYIEFNFNKETFNENKEEILKKLSSHKDIKKVIVRENKKALDDKLATNVNNAGALSYFEDEDYTGAGIKIGMMESGIVNTSHTNLTDATIITYDQVGFTEPVTDHATTMANILVGSYGIAQDAELYSTAITGNALNEIDWLINRGVDIVNMSYGEANPIGEYNTDSSFIDYAIKNYDMVGVAAIGNGGENAYIGNPALGYNVISVGDIYSSNIPASENSLKTSGTRGKPTILAPGNFMTIPNVGSCMSGSSLSCAVVTGCISLLLEEYPVLKTKPMQVVSLVCAGALRLPDYVDNGGGNGFSSVVGAGKFNLTKTMDSFNKTTTITNVNPGHHAPFYLYEWSVYLSAGVNLRAAFSWAATTDYVEDTIEFTKYICVIYDYTGQSVAVGGSLFDNVCMANLITTREGTYYIRLKMETPLVGTEDKIYFAYRYR